MKTLATTKLWTDDPLLALDRDGRKHELWFGKVLTMPPAGAEHGEVNINLILALGACVKRPMLGRVYEGQTGFRLSLEFCFEPDVSFVSTQRLKFVRLVKEKMLHGTPDFAIEVLAPPDSITKTEEKITLYLTHGTRLAWMVDLKNRSVRVYREPDKFELLGIGRILTGNSVIPGFRLPVARLFEDTG